jgi:hypothetical protein
MATITFTVAAPMQPVYGANRTITKVQSIVSTATFSTGDVYILNNIKVPHGAVITSVNYKGSVVDGTYLIEMGMQGSGGTLDIFGSKTFSATAVTTLTAITAAMPYSVSVSDDAVDRYQTFAVRVDGAATSGTASVSLQFVIQYYTR